LKNILFIMCDQLRHDYLSCAGHPHLKTPNIDALAARGVRFDRAFVQSPVCGPSRMSYYTGRYVASHGAIWNFVPLRVGERTMGDYLRPLGLRTALVGKTHMAADEATMALYGIPRDSAEGVLLAECGFEPYDRDDGIYPPGFAEKGRKTKYHAYLQAKGHGGENPWHDHANAAAGPEGGLASGWYLANAPLPVRLPAEDTETPYMTRRAMEFMAEAGEAPWCLHLSYIKPHWPLMAPAPYNDMYGPADVVPAVRDPAERRAPHPLLAEFQSHPESLNFSQDRVRETAIPTYMGLVRQIDDSLGELFAFMAEHDLIEKTMIVFCSDHGDYLGDHWLGEKELFHECAVRVPMIVVDPSPAADATRGAVQSALVEAVDLLPTFIEFAGGTVPGHVLEGRSLLPLLRGAVPPDWRDLAVSEFDYSFRRFARETLGRDVNECGTWMLRSARWKYVFCEGFRPLLFDLAADPDELVDLGGDPGHAGICAEFEGRLFEWLRRRKRHVTISDADIAAWTDRAMSYGIKIGFWSEAETVREADD